MPQREYTDEEVMNAPSFDQAFAATNRGLPGTDRKSTRLNSSH